MSSLSGRIADFVVGARFEDLSPRTADMTKRCVLDAIGVSLAASGLGEGCRAFVDLVIEQGGHPQCTVFGATRKVPPEAAAYANGALAHALDFEDSHDGALVHPNAPTVPAAVAIAEAFGPVSGRELITAVAVGCDVVVRMGLCLRVSLAEFGWYPPPILAAFGATAAAARLLKLDRRQVLDAFSLTLCQATCSGEIIHSPDSLIRAVRDAFAARAGVSSALLARRGVTGFEQPFEGRAGFFATFARGAYDPEILVRDLGQRYEIENISFKPWPSCRGTHAAIEAALACRREDAVVASEIDRVLIRGGNMLRMLAEPRESKQRPATAIDAKFSLPFTVATALVKGRVGLAEFLPKAVHDPEILALAARVDVDHGFALPSSIGTLIDIQLRNGRRVERMVSMPLGAPDKPLVLEALIAKFEECATHSPHPPRTRAFVDAILTLESAGNVEAEVMPLLR